MNAKLLNVSARNNGLHYYDHIKSVCCPMLLTSLQAVVILKLSETDQQGREAILKYHKMHIAHFQIKCIELISTTLQEGRRK